MTSSSTAAPQFDVFVSYARADADVVSGLVSRLEADGFRVWFDAKQMGRGHTTIGQLADGIARSAHMIACLSDAYIERDFTAFELDTNQSFDPANKQNRTIPVLVKPLSKEIPTQIRAFTYGDLTSSETYESEYERVASMLRRPRETRTGAFADQATLRQKCDSPFEHQTSAPNLALMELRVAAESLLRFLYGRELGLSPEGQTLEALRRILLTKLKLPPPVRIAISTMEAYGNYVAEDVEESASVTPESIRPGLSALRLFADWVFAHYFEQQQPADRWEAMWRQLPAADDANERWIPGTAFVVGQPRLSVSEVCAVYPGRDTKWRQTVTVTLHPVNEENEKRFFALAPALIRGCDASVVRPLDAGKVSVEGHSVCLYVVTEWVESISARDLAARFGALPLTAVLELGVAAAAGLELLHGLTPALVLGDLNEDSLLIDRQGKVKLCWTGSQGFAGSGTQLQPKDDLEALQATLHRLAVSPTEQTEVVVDETQTGIPVDGGAAQARGLLDERLRQCGKDEPRLRELVSSYRSGQALSVRHEERTVEAAELRAGFGMVREIPCECMGAWPAAADRLLILENGHRLSLYEIDRMVWQTSRPFAVRRAAVGGNGSLACAGWNGELVIIRPDGTPQEYSLDGPVGDLVEAEGDWIAGTWRQALVRVDGEGVLTRISPAPPGGVYRLAVDSSGGRLAVASLNGVLSIYSKSGRVAEMESQGRMPMLSFCGRRILVLAGNRLNTFEVDGRRVVSEKPQGVGRRWLARWPSEKRCLLADETGGAWLLEESGTILPYATFGPLRALRTAPAAAGRILVAREGGWAYWREGSIQHEWPDALEATFSGCGTAIAVRKPGSVEVWVDPI